MKLEMDRNVVRQYLFTLKELKSPCSDEVVQLNRIHRGYQEKVLGILIGYKENLSQ